MAFQPALQVKAVVTKPFFEINEQVGHLQAKRACQQVRGSGKKGVAESLPVKVKALEDFIQIIATKLFKQCIGDDRGKNRFGNHTGSGDGAGVAPLKA